MAVPKFARENLATDGPRYATPDPAAIGTGLPASPDPVVPAPGWAVPFSVPAAKSNEKKGGA